MAKTPTVGIQFHLDPGWMGGAYYLKNMLLALATLSDAQRPNIIIVSNDLESFEFLAGSGYPALRLASADEILADPDHMGLDLLFPIPIPGLNVPALTWIPDFQEKHLGYLFSSSEIESRQEQHLSFFREAALLLSSESAMEDFRRFYPDAHIPAFVVPFTSFLPESLPPWHEVRATHDLPDKFFFAPNQFWMHKNHIVILAALKKLAEKGVRPIVCFSGKEFDRRATGYAKFLRQLTIEWRIADQIRFLGFMPRDEQLATMKQARAVIQPSMFEGWSTVVEDAKALNQFLLVSSLAVHREQLDNNAQFFDPSDYATLASYLEQHWNGDVPRVENDYCAQQRRFGVKLAAVFKAVTAANRRATAKSKGSVIVELTDGRKISGLSPNATVQDLGDKEVRGHWLDSDVLKINRPSSSDETILCVRLVATRPNLSLQIKIGSVGAADKIEIADENVEQPIELFVDVGDYPPSDPVLVEVLNAAPRHNSSRDILVEAVSFIRPARH